MHKLLSDCGELKTICHWLGERITYELFCIQEFMCQRLRWGNGCGNFNRFWVLL